MVAPLGLCPLHALQYAALSWLDAAGRPIARAPYWQVWWDCTVPPVTLPDLGPDASVTGRLRVGFGPLGLN